MEEDGRPASAPPPECSEVDQGDEGVQGEGDQQAPIKLRRKKVAGRAGAKMLRAMKTQSLDNVILPTQLQEVRTAVASKCEYELTERRWRKPRPSELRRS